MTGMIHFDNVSYHYDGQHPVLKNVNLTINKGEFVALIGGNGSGKTTLAKHCNGLFKPTSGNVYVHGKDTAHLSVADLCETVAYCYQNPDHQIFQSNIWDEVAFGPKNLGLAQDEIESRVDEALEAVGIAHLKEEEPHFTSKGERQKIAVASILAMKPEAVVLDEPTTGLDHKGMLDMMDVISRLHQLGHTIMIITHDMRLVAEYAQRVILLDQGKVIHDDSTPAQLFAESERLAEIHIEPPAVCRFGVAVGLNPPLPLTIGQLQHRIRQDRRDKQK